MFYKVLDKVGKHCSVRWGLMSDTPPSLASNRQVEQVSPRTTIFVLGPRYPSVSNVPDGTAM